MAIDYRDLTSRMNELTLGGTPFALVTLVAVKGSAPQLPGAKAIVTESGLEMGNVGGGKVEAAAVRHAQSLLRSGGSCELVTWNLQNDIQMTCGGEVQFFFDIFAFSTWEVAVFGAGHVSQTLIRMLLHLDCRITCIDQRSEWLDRLPNEPRLRKVQTETLASRVAALPPDAFILCLSQGHATDLPVLHEVLKTRRPPYLGVIGSNQKARRLRRELADLGLNEDETERFHCPMGLPLGNNTPGEIAVSILAQLIQSRDTMTGRNKNRHCPSKAAQSPKDPVCCDASMDR